MIFKSRSLNNQKTTYGGGTIPASVWCLVESVVKNRGRGSLGKVGLLPHSLFVQKKWVGGFWGTPLIHAMFNRDGCLKSTTHPMAESVAFAPIVSWCVAHYTRTLYRNDSKLAMEIFEELLISWLRYMQIDHIHKEPEKLYNTMIRVSNMTESSTDVHALEPLMPDKIRDQELVQIFIDIFDTVRGNCLPTMYDEYDEPGYKDSDIKRIHLNGNFSKGEILMTAMLFNGSQPAVLDFEDCTNLDEECLELIFKWLYPPMIVRLKGTSINKNSTLLERLNENRYEEDEIQFVFEPKVLSIEDKLKRENKQLMEENASLKRQIDEMKKNM